MKSGRHHADSPRGIDRRQIGVTFETNLPHLRTIEHSRIRRAVRRVARRASFESHGAVFEGERSSLVAMTVEAAGLIRSEGLLHHCLNAAVRIMTIDAAHRAFGHAMMKRLLELRRDGQMAGLALFIDRITLARDQSFRCRRVNRVAARARDLIFRMTALQSPDMRRLI